MHVRFLLNELQKQRTKHLTYHRVISDMECKYPQVQTKGECLICWDTFRYFKNWSTELVDLNLALPVDSHVVIVSTAHVYANG